MFRYADIEAIPWTLYGFTDVIDRPTRIFERIRWPDGPTCPYCARHRVARRNDQRGARWQCYDCKKSFTAIQGTLFHHTKVPLKTWFALILLLEREPKLTMTQITNRLRTRRGTLMDMRDTILWAKSDNPEQWARFVARLAELSGCALAKGSVSPAPVDASSRTPSLA